MVSRCLVTGNVYVGVLFACIDILSLGYGWKDLFLLAAALYGLGGHAILLGFLKPCFSILHKDDKTAGLE